MTKTHLILGALLLGHLCLADEVTKRTVLTLNEPLIVAGVPQVTLEPGRYAIRVLTSTSNKNIVQIFNERGDKLLTTVLTINNYRVVATDKTVLRFWETPYGNPLALRSWFPPFENYGQEFVSQGPDCKDCRARQSTRPDGRGATCKGAGAGASASPGG